MVKHVIKWNDSQREDFDTKYRKQNLKVKKITKPSILNPTIGTLKINDDKRGRTVL